MEVEGTNLGDSNVGLEEEGDRQNVADMLKLVGKLEDKQQQPVGDMAMGDILLSLEDMKDTEVMEDSLLEDSSLENSSSEDSSSEDRKLLVEVLNKEKLKVQVHMTELMERGFFLAFWH